MLITTIVLMVAGCGGGTTVQQARQAVKHATAKADDAKTLAAAAFDKAARAAIATDTAAEKRTGCRRITAALAATHPPPGETRLARDWQATCRTIGITLTVP